MKCPSCRTELSQISYEGVHIHTCNGCGGEFVGADQMASIVRIRNERFPAEVTEGTARARPAFGRTPASVSHCSSCPSCRSATDVINYAADTGVSVDRCRSCGGLWLDNTEIEKIQALLERWEDEAPQKRKAAAEAIAAARRAAQAASRGTFAGSRFAFMNAVINRLLDAA